MNRFMAIATVLCMIAMKPAYAERYSLNISVGGEPIRAWISVQSAGKSSLVPAGFSNSGSYYVLTADLDPVDYLAPVVQLSSGEIISEPIVSAARIRQHGAMRDEKTAPSLDRVNILKQQLSALQAEKRHQAGYDGVDEIYEEIARVEAEIAALKLRVGK